MRLVGYRLKSKPPIDVWKQVPGFCGGKGQLLGALGEHVDSCCGVSFVTSSSTIVTRLPVGRAAPSAVRPSRSHSKLTLRFVRPRELPRGAPPGAALGIECAVLTAESAPPPSPRPCWRARLRHVRS